MTALVAPAVVARPWIGEEATQPGAAVFGRALGGRDLALGLGALLARSDRKSLRGWVAAAFLADMIDAAVTGADFGNLPRQGRLVVLAAACGAAALGAIAVGRL